MDSHAHPRQQCHRRLQEALCRAILEGDGPPRPN